MNINLTNYQCKEGFKYIQANEIATVSIFTETGSTLISTLKSLTGACTIGAFEPMNCFFSAGLYLKQENWILLQYAEYKIKGVVTIAENLEWPIVKVEFFLLCFLIAAWAAAKWALRLANSSGVAAFTEKWA